ncbi:DUF2625 family protein [Frigoribacterium sp. 2-23]|uniref:DUF2625 family protein n=1 Tax=Frigoribacterium sp. 2-23 TaxID=3415006 RepID=UPI003C705E35
MSLSLDDAWPELSELIAASPLDAVVVPPHDGSGTATRLRLGSRFYLGALASHTSGVLIDQGWLRLLGGSSSVPGLPGIDEATADQPGLVVIAYDVLGGAFALDGGSLGAGDGSVHHYSVMSLEWENLELGHSAFVRAMLGGATTRFYESLRWPGWQDDVAGLAPTQGLSLYPYPFTAEGKDPASVSRAPVSFAELIGLHNDIAGQVGLPARVPLPALKDRP